MIKVSNELGKMFSNCTSSKDFDRILKKDGQKELSDEVLRIYHTSDVKDLNGFMPYEIVYLHMLIKGFELIPKRYRVILKRGVMTPSGVLRNFAYASIDLNGYTVIGFYDDYYHVPTLTKDELKQLPEYMQEFAEEVK